ncbi:hypothetical protein BJV82DRAFT_670163 [Fennellomyces sp. T-0311]|nr:hypothetical protein BJV82DRAFT_670163 [Fennellomyces sp. T-0311]
MNISDILNPQSINSTSCFVPVETRLTSPPLSPKSPSEFSYDPRLLQVHGKPRSRFSDIEDAIICDGVAKGLTWGQISRQLPHRKRATCFNRYRTLQGIRKSRKRPSESKQRPMTPPSPASCSTSSAASPPWFPSTPPGSSSSSPVTTCSSSVADPTGFHLPSPRQILLNAEDGATTTFNHSIPQHDQCQPSVRLPPLIVPTARYPSQAP